MPNGPNGSHDSLHNRLAAVEDRQRQLEIGHAEYARDVSHIYDTLDELKSMMKTSVELQERQVTQRESLGRAFGAIREVENRTLDLEGRDTDIERKVDRYVNLVKGAMWVTAMGWTLLIGGGGLWFWAQ